MTEDFTSDGLSDESIPVENPSEEEGPEIPMIDDGEIVDDSFEEISTGKNRYFSFGYCSHLGRRERVN